MQWIASGKNQVFFHGKNRKVAGGTLTLRKLGSIIIMLDEKMDIYKCPDPIGDLTWLENWFSMTASCCKTNVVFFAVAP